MRQLAGSILLACIVTLAPRASDAAQIGEFSTSLGEMAGGESAFVVVCISAPQPPPELPPCRIEEPLRGAHLFEELVLTSADAGSTFEATSATDPDFDDFAALLTNRLSDEIWVYQRVGLDELGYGNTEAGRFFGDTSGAAPLDFAGYVIESITMTLSSDFKVDPSGQSGSVRVQVFGHCLEETDTDGDGFPDACDDCPYAAHPGQKDRGGIGPSSPPDGIGDACQCGDVNGDGRVTLTDAVLITRAVLEPPTATLAHPELCDVGGAAGCSVADALVLTRALLTPPTATVEQVCAPANP